MLLSVFTPTNDVQHLHDAWQSLRKQSNQNWEWVLLFNGEARKEQVPWVEDDERIKCFRYDEGTPPYKIGALKRRCCQLATGDAFVELDHDDMLTPNCLADVHKCFTEEDAGFVYSDAAVFNNKDMRQMGYSPDYGWETYDFLVYGQKFMATRAFPLTARSLCEIYYAPDHVRCWRREAYEAVAGHDPALAVGDDHDLMCRTYISGARFEHTGGVGYLYRNHKSNNVKLQNADIQVQQAKNRDKYIYQLIDSWTQREGLGFLDLEKIQWVEGLPCIPSGYTARSLGCVRAFNCFNFVPQSHVVWVLQQLEPLLAPGGWVCVRVPSTDGAAGFAPCNRSYWNGLTFEYLTNQKYARLMPDQRHAMPRFQRVRCITVTERSMFAPFDVPMVYADLCVLKGQRQPGGVFI